LISKRLTPYVFLIPAIIVFGILTFQPIIFGTYISLNKWDWRTSQSKIEFIGLQNYAVALGEQRFWADLLHTFYFSAGAVAIEFFLGFGMALLLSQKIRGAAFFRSVFIFPLMISDIVAALMWKVMYDPTLGIINYILGLVRLPTPAWLSDPTTVMPAIIFIDAWWQTGNITLILLAGLLSLPKAPFEAAVVDGASKWQTFRHITLPIMKPIIIVALIFRTIDTLRVFAIVFGTSFGGPERMSEVMQLWIYLVGIGRFLDMGYAAAIAILFSLIILVVVLVYHRMGARI
jgi:multiple sugar transport system permease protein